MEETFEITLSNGTSITARLNGNCFITSTELDLEILNDLNLLNIIINGEEYSNYHCDNVWESNGEYWFIVREKTPAELELEKLNAKIEFLMLLQGVENDE